MNEPSNFVDGSVSGCTSSSLDNPPFTPRMFPNVEENLLFLFLDVLGGSLASKTLCPSARQYISNHYNLHNMFGYFEAQASNMSVVILSRMLRVRKICLIFQCDDQDSKQASICAHSFEFCRLRSIYRTLDR
jgi:lysosomal alpha-glucosidase